MGLLETLADIISRAPRQKAEYGPMSDALAKQNASYGATGGLLNAVDPYILDWKNSPEHRFARGEIGFTPEVADRVGVAIATAGGGIGKKGVPGYVEDAATREANFKKWFGESKVVDAEGKPLTVYHGSNADFEAFDPAFKGSQTANPTSFWGHFFSKNTDEASRYTNDFGKKMGGSVYPSNVSIKNPYVMPYGEFDGLATTNVKLNAQGGTPKENYYKTLDILKGKLDDIKAAGHDGIIINPGSKYEEIVAFDPTQIKSIFNRGTYDLADPNILKSLIPAAATAYGIEEVLPYD
jgi:hypothetical protein